MTKIINHYDSLVAGSSAKAMDIPGMEFPLTMISKK